MIDVSSGQLVDARVVAAVLADAAAWGIPVLAAIAAGVALVTALIQRRTALTEREGARLNAVVHQAPVVPGVLIPNRLARFVDRATVLERAVAQIRAGDRVLAFEGGAGVGKSATATELAHRLRSSDAGGLSDLRAYDYLWVDCRERGLTLADVCQQMTLLTGDQSVSAVADGAKLDALRAHLARHRTVLVLDNVRLGPDASIDPFQQLVRTVPSGSLVIASVNSSHVLEAATRMFLEDLDPPHVQELIACEAVRLGLDTSELFDSTLAARVQCAVGGNPRLIESFLRAVARSPASLEDLIEALERGEGLGELFVPAWEELSAQARRVLGACAYLRGQCVAEQLRVACDVDQEVVSSALVELVDVGLMGVVRGVRRPDAYACSPAAQRFALAQTSPEEIGAFTDRLIGLYVRQFAAEPENAKWAVPHVSGVKAVLQWAFDLGRDADGQRLFATVLDALFTLGLFDDRIITGRLAYESAMQASNHRDASLASDVLSSTHAARGELEQAREAVALGLIAAERSGDVGERARQMRAHGLTLYKAGRPAEALAVMDGADGLARETGDLEVVVNVLGVRTVVNWFIGAVDASRAAAEEGLQVCEGMSWQRATAYPLRNLDELAIHRGAFEDARALIDQARTVADTHGDRRQLARIHLTSARCALFAGQLQTASEEAASAERNAIGLGLGPESREARAIARAAGRARRVPLLGLVWARRRPLRFTDAPVGGD